MPLGRAVTCTLAIMIILPTYFSEVSAQCTTGDVRLVGGSVQNEGRVEVCLFSHWGTVCDDEWGGDDAKVVCRQLGYRTYGATALRNTFGPGRGQIVLDNVQCNPKTHRRLLDCGANRFNNLYKCDHDDDAGVRCSTYNDQRRLTEINVTTVEGNNNDYVIVLITWETENIAAINKPTMYELECHAEGHRIAISVSNQTTFTHLGGLLRSKLSRYTCCISEVYAFYMTEGVCTIVNIQTSTEDQDMMLTTARESMPTPHTSYAESTFAPEMLLTTARESISAPHTSNSESTYTPEMIFITCTKSTNSTLALHTSTSNYLSTCTAGGVLGVIILVLLVMSVISIVCLLQPKLRAKVLPTRLSQLIDRNIMSTSPTDRTDTTLSHSTTCMESSILQDVIARSTDQGASGSIPISNSNTSYGNLGPAYDRLHVSNLNRQPQRQQEMIEIPISESYEFAETHAETDRRVQVEVSEISEALREKIMQEDD